MNSFKNKKRSKPNSSKKSDKERSSSGPFADQIVMKNYRSANLTGNPIKVANSKQMDHSKQRYQYHKRIRSDTGHTIINPLEQVYDKKYINKDAKITNPSLWKPKTDISTPIITKKDHRSSVIEKKHPDNIINTANTIQVTKYDFIPSFKHHKTINLDQNTNYRKFKPNKNPSTLHKVDMSRVK
jgi:hypothetical protein